MDKLTTREIEAKIDQLSDRIEALKGIIPEIKNEQAKVVLEEQITSYNNSIDQFRLELAKRHKQ